VFSRRGHLRAPPTFPRGALRWCYKLLPGAFIKLWDNLPLVRSHWCSTLRGCLLLVKSQWCSKLRDNLHLVKSHWCSNLRDNLPLVK
jgi:hypothetical protein